VTTPRIPDTDLAAASDVIDAVHAASTGDTQLVALLVERLTPEQATHALGLAVGIAAGALNVLVATTGVDRDIWVRQMRQRAAA
jgi:hypothetical protein